MKHILSAAALMLLSFVFVNVLSAQDAPRIIKGGILNGKATSLPKPEYPEAAKSAKLEGLVKIKVLIDEEGNIASAEPSTEPTFVMKENADGSSEKVEQPAPDPILVEAARTAAMSAKFSPTRLSGVPVKVAGVITYNFVAGDEKLKLIPHGGVLNGNAVEFPKPGYPPAAQAVRASGTVSVRVTIDEEGNVIAAEAVSGHPLLRAAAVEAAREAKFKPTFLSGVPVKVSGVLAYTFVLPDDGTN